MYHRDDSAMVVARQPNYENGVLNSCNIVMCQSYRESSGGLIITDISVNIPGSADRSFNPSCDSTSANVDARVTLNSAFISMGDCSDKHMVVIVFDDHRTCNAKWQKFNEK